MTAGTEIAPGDGLMARFWRRRPVVAVVRLAGVITATSRLSRGLSLESVAPALRAAFRGRRIVAVALAINSPGGSAVQSSLLFRRIRALAEETGKPVTAFVEDAAASGGYWLACAADEIYADASSIVGSIGVLSAGFGLHDLLARAGIERRVHVQGARKMLLDPFAPEKPEDVERLSALQADIFEAFRDVVRDRRGSRLVIPEPELFTGDVWTGRRAVEHGLVDGIDDLRGVMRRRYGKDVRFRAFGAERGLLSRVLPGRRIGGGALPAASRWAASAWADDLVDALETRAAWARYGL
jgi:signal peptide peptidase SppA